MFLAQGFDAASMGAIAREAGVSKGTLYVYFKSKEELFEAIVEEQCRQQAEQIFTLDRSRHRERAAAAWGSSARFLIRPGGVSALRTIIAIADRMPEIGAKFYCAGPARGIDSLRRYLEEKVAGRRAQAARLRGRGGTVHRHLRVNDLQANAIQLRRRAAGRQARPRRRHGREGLPCDLRKLEAAGSARSLRGISRRLSNGRHARRGWRISRAGGGGAYSMPACTRSRHSLAAFWALLRSALES